MSYAFMSNGCITWFQNQFKYILLFAPRDSSVVIIQFQSGVEHHVPEF